MEKKNTPGMNLRQSRLLSQYNLHHGFSTRVHGNMHARPDNRARVIHYLQSVIPGTFAFTSFKQTHSSSIAHIDSTNAGAYIEDYDGGITALRNHIVGVNFADCTPVLLFDPATHICGAVHAGWRGVYNNILSVAVKKMILSGADPGNILVSIGPHIRVCCYNIDEQRQKKFLDGFGKTVLKKQSDAVYLSMEACLLMQIAEVGISNNHVDVLPECTSCSDSYFSFRREGKGVNEMLAFIGLT